MRDQITVAETCRRYGISRQTFYVYQRRLYADGVTALAPLSRRPLTSQSRQGSRSCDCARPTHAGASAPSTPICGVQERRPFRPYRRFIVYCNVIHSSLRAPSVAPYPSGDASNASHR